MQPVTVRELAKSMEIYGTIIENIEYFSQLQKQCIGVDMLGVHHELGIVIKDLNDLLVDRAGKI